MNLIEFIMSNLVFIIVIVWFLFSLFGRRGGESEEGQGQRRRAPRPEHQPEPVSGPDQQRRPPPEPQVQSQRTEDNDAELGFPWERVEDTYGTDSGKRNDSPGRDMRETAHTLNRYEQYVQELRKQGERTKSVNKNKSPVMSAERAALQRRGSSPSERRMTALAERKIPDFQQMDQSSVVKGFVWSEVFGAPLAKRKQRVYSMDQRMGRRHYP